MTGTLQYGPGTSETAGAGQRPGGYPVSVLVPPKPVDRPEPEAKDEEGEESLDEELLDLQVKHLAGIRKRRAHHAALLDRLLAERPDGLPLLVERLRFAAADDSTDAADVMAAADAVIARIDAAAVAAALGVEADLEDPAQKKAREETEERKGELVEALRARCEALLKREDDTAFDAAYRELDRWSDTSEKDSVKLLVAHERKRNRAAVALAALNEHIDDADPDRELYELRASLFEDLGWDAWAAHERQWLRLRFPADYPAF
jgi:tripeptidyl-peptidase-2